jgi:hypothetical protein
MTLGRGGSKLPVHRRMAAVLHFDPMLGPAGVVRPIPVLRDLGPPDPCGRRPEQDHFVDGVIQSLTTDLYQRLVRDCAQHRSNATQYGKPSGANPNDHSG